MSRLMFEQLKNSRNTPLSVGNYQALLKPEAEDRTKSSQGGVW